jgi:hypothetical protein
MSYDPPMRWYYPAGVILAILLGLGLGRILAPRYHAPADSSDARLKSRAVELYQAGRLFDAQRIRQLYTPARQAADADQLLKEAKRQHAYWNELDDAARAEQTESAKKITLDLIEVESYIGEGWGWAITSGTAPLLVDGHEVPQTLDRVVWVLADGDWWIYDRTPVELNAYGNPPDPVLKAMQMMVPAGGMRLGQSPATDPVAGDPSA